MSEIDLFAWVCAVEYPTNWELIYSVDVYSQQEKHQASAEVAYFLELGTLPSWATYIERVENVNGAFIFIHADIRRHV